MRLLAATALVCLGLPVYGQTQLPDGTTIQGARYDGPTERYPHGVLGDDVEYTSLILEMSAGRDWSVTLDRPLVFEDTAPRLADLDGDGAMEVITVESHEQQGARLAVWGIRDSKITRIAATPHIGTRFRWLAVVGAADLDGDGTVEVAFVDRPHLAKTLRVWSFRDDRLTEVGSLAGVTNHRIGEVDIAGGIRTCGDVPEMIVATANWTRVQAIAFDGASFSVKDVGPHANRQSFADAMSC